jgi:hypothetical protein
MKKLFIASIFLVLLAACQPPAPSATATPAPPTDTPTPPTGIIGTVAYTGLSNGSILVLALDHAPAQNENPTPVAIETYRGNQGDFTWNLPAGTYFITAFFTIDREAQGPPLPNEPLIFCDPVQVTENQLTHINIDLTDEDAGGTNTSCLVQN